MNIARACECITQVVSAPIGLAYQIMRAFKQFAHQPACVINLGDDKTIFRVSGTEIAAMAKAARIVSKVERQIELNALVQGYVNRIVSSLNSYTLSYDKNYDGEDDVDGTEYKVLDNIHHLNRYRKFRLIVVTDGASLKAHDLRYGDGVRNVHKFSWRLAVAPLIVKLFPLVTEAYRGEVVAVRNLKLNGNDAGFRPDFVIDRDITKNAELVARYTSGAYDGIRWMEKHYPAFHPTGADMAEEFAETCHIDGDIDHAWDDIDQSYDEIDDANGEPSLYVIEKIGLDWKARPRNQRQLRHTARVYAAPGVKLIPCGQTRGYSSPFFDAEERLNAMLMYTVDRDSDSLRQNRFAAELASFYDR